MDNIEIIYISANPKDTPDVNTISEYQIINEVFLNKGDNLFRLESPIFGATDKVLAAKLNNCKAAEVILHFSGHGSQIGNFILENSDGTSNHTNAKQLAEFLGKFKNILGVVYSNCYSDDLVKYTIEQKIGFSVGYEETVNKESAKNFAYEFYLTLITTGEPKLAFDRAEPFSKLDNSVHKAFYKGKDINFFADKNEKTESKKAAICYQGKLLNKDFKPSLLSINVCKYLVYDRYSNIRIWIGDPNLIIELNKIEHQFNGITKGRYGERNWEITNAKEFKNGNIDKGKAKFVIIESEKDYSILQSSLVDLKEEKSVIICYNLSDISLSKIYAYDLFNRLASSSKSMPVIIENDIYLKQSTSESLPFYSLIQEIHKTLKQYVPEKMRLYLRSFCEKEISDKDFFILVKQETNQNQLLNTKSALYSLLYKFGNKKQRETLTQSIESGEDLELVYAIIKDDLSSIKDFLNFATENQLFTIVQKERRALLLLLIAGQRYGEGKDKLDQLLAKFGMEDYEMVKIIKNENNCPLLKNTIDLWIKNELHPQQYKEFIATSDYNHVRSELNYAWLMIEDHSNDSLKRILKDEDLRLGFKIINPDEVTPQVEGKFKIEENLFIYEI